MRFHPDRAVGSHRDHRHSGGDPLPGFRQGAREGATVELLEQSDWASPGGTCSGCFHKYESGYVPTTTPGNRYEPFFPYIKNRQVWWCPSSNQYRSYGWARGNENRALAQCYNPSQTVMFADSYQTASWNIAWLTTNWLDVNTDRDCCSNMSTGQAHPHWVSDVHNSGANLAFWDGHVKWLSTTSIPIGRHGNGLKFVLDDPWQP